MASAELNVHHRAYLQAIFGTYQAAEPELGSIPFRPFQNRPNASEGRVPGMLEK